MVVEPATGMVGKQVTNPEAGSSNLNAITVEEWEYWDNNDPETRSEELVEVMISEMTPLLE
jgi:hypothetical protein